MAKQMIGLRLPETILAIIDKMAKEQARTRANMAEFIILDWLREHRPELLADSGKE